jgi:hypothetical protein
MDTGIHLPWTNSKLKFIFIACLKNTGEAAPRASILPEFLTLIIAASIVENGIHF